MSAPTPLLSSWHHQPTMLLAREALGKVLVTQVDGKLTAGRIVETEPYSARMIKRVMRIP